ELRPAVVVARLYRFGPLARVAAVALQQQRLRRRKAQVEHELARRDLRDIRVAHERKGPGVNPDARRLLVDAGQTEALTRGALVMEQMRTTRIGERGVRKHELSRREGARIRLGDTRPVAKERHLHTVRVAGRVSDPA